MAHTGIGGDDNGPERAHNDDKKHGGFGLPEPQQCERDPADAGQCLQAEGQGPNRIVKNLPARG